MIFAKVDVCFWSHEKFVAAGPAACGYWAAAVTYLREHESTDGFLRPHILGILLAVGDRQARKLCEILVKVGLFFPQDGGYVLVRYAEKNETRDEIEARRSATAARVDAFRKRRSSGHDRLESNAVTNGVQVVESASSVTVLPTPLVTGDVPGSGSPSGSGSDRRERSEIAAAARHATNATADGAFGLAVSAWCEGVTKATGAPCSVARGGAVQALVDAIVTHCPDVNARVDWARSQGAKFASVQLAAGQIIKPHGFGDWLNSVSPDKPSGVRRVAVAALVQPAPPGGSRYAHGDGK